MKIMITVAHANSISLSVLLEANGAAHQSMLEEEVAAWWSPNSVRVQTREPPAAKLFVGVHLLPTIHPEAAVAIDALLCRPKAEKH